MNPSSSFNLLLTASGMTRDEACDYLNCSINSSKDWARGRYNAPEGVLNEMARLVELQGLVAERTITQIVELSEKHGKPNIIDLGYPADNYEANQLGFPCVNAWLAMAGRFVAWCEKQTPRIEVVLVPRGSTPATAAAIEAHEHLL